MPEVRPILAALDGVDLLALHHVRLDGVALGQNAKAAGEGDLRIVVKLLVGEEHNERRSSQTALMAETVSSSRSAEQSTPRISAPIVGPSGRTSSALAQCHRPMVAQRV